WPPAHLEPAPGEAGDTLGGGDRPDLLGGGEADGDSQTEGALRPLAGDRRGAAAAHFPCHARRARGDPQPCQEHPPFLAGRALEHGRAGDPGVARMLRFILRRLVQMLPLLVAITLISFLVMRLAPGDYLTQM